MELKEESFCAKKQIDRPSECGLVGFIGGLQLITIGR
jgi:hypothetical protein